MQANIFVNSPLSWALFTLFIVVSTTVIWAFVYWWKKDRHTRERFAFYGAASLVGLITLLLLQLTTNASLSTILASSFFGIIKGIGLAQTISIFEYSYQPTPLTPTEAVIYFGSICVLAYFFLKIFMHWDGQKSKAQYEQEQNMIPPSVLSDVLLLLARDKQKREKLAPYQEETDAHQSLLEGAKDAKVWHEQARQLWLLHERHYLFNDEYDLAHKCWWGEKKQTGTLACLACFSDMPSEPEIMALAEYAHQINPLRKREGTIEIILACKTGEFSPMKERRTGYTLYQTNQAELLNNLVDFSDYFDEIRYRVERATLPDSELTLEKTYTPSSYRLTGDGIIEGNDLESFIQHWLNENNTRQLALLGEYGQGKSTISLLLSYHLIKQAQNNPQARIPVMLELRGKSPRSLTPNELLATWAHLYRIDVLALLQLLMAGRLLLIFEGFDEIDLTGDTDTRINHFRTLWRLCYPQAKILITGRPNFFLDSNECKRALGIDVPDPNRPYCQAIYLAPFSTKQIEESLRSVDEETRKEIIELSKHDRKFYEIVSRPSLLFIVSTLWKRENLSAQCGKISSALVMQLFIRHSYRRQGAKQAERNFMALNTAERAYFMTGIAAYMAVKGLPNQISRHQLDEVIHKLVESIPDDVSRSVGTIENETRHPLKKSHPERFDWERHHTETFEHIKTDVRACGILVTDLSKDGTFKFAHKSFMEFLQAQLVSQLFVEDEAASMGARSIINSFGLDISHMDSSLETMSFLAELLRDGVCGVDDPKKEDEIVAKILFSILVLGDFGHHGVGRKFASHVVRMNLWMANKLAWLQKRKQSNLRFVVRLPELILTLLMTVLAVSLTSWSFGDHNSEFFHKNIAVTLVMATSAMVTSVMITQLMYMKRRLNSSSQNTGVVQRLEIWFSVCSNFGLSRDVIANCIGKNIVAIMERQAR